MNDNNPLNDLFNLIGRYYPKNQNAPVKGALGLLLLN